MQFKSLFHPPHPAFLPADTFRPLFFVITIIRLHAGCAVFLQYGRRSTCDT